MCLSMFARLQAREGALLRLHHFVERGLHFGPGLVAIVDDQQLVDRRLPQVHGPRYVVAAPTRENHIHLDKVLQIDNGYTILLDLMHFGSVLGLLSVCDMNTTSLLVSPQL